MLLWVVLGVAVVAGLVWYGDRVQKRERQDQGAAVAEAVAHALRSQPSVDELVARVRAELDDEMAERMTDAISDVQDSILAAVSAVLVEARGHAGGDVSDASEPVIGNGRRAHHRLQWSEDAKAWVDPISGRAAGAIAV